RCWSSSVAPRTAGWPPGRGRTRSSRTRWTRPSWPPRRPACSPPGPSGSRPAAPADGVEGRAWPQLLTSLLRGEQLSADDTAWAMGEVMAGEATPVQLAGFVVALRAKGESAQEVDGLVRAMLAAAHRIEVPGP